MNKVNEEIVETDDSPCADLMQKSKAEPHNSPRAGAKIFARRIGKAMQMAPVQKCGTGSRMNAPRSFERGRSMIEMLGVLAIIGVLSIAGLMGYRYAMNKHKANLILNDVSLAMADLTVQDPDGGAIARHAVAFTPETGLTMEAERTAEGNNIVYVNDVPKAVCQILIQIKPTDIYKNIYDGDLNALTSCNDNQAMAFGSKDSAEPPVTSECQNDSDCGVDQACQNGHCVAKSEPTDPCENMECLNGGTCKEGSCECVNGYTGSSCEVEPDCNDSKPCTSPKQCENYICVCPTVANCKTLNNTTCACDKCEDGYIKKDGKCEKCTSPKEPNADQTACECPKIANCKAYNDSTCACDTCEDGYTWNASTKQCEVPQASCQSGYQTCTNGSDSWCCFEKNTCGTEKGKCCLGSNCCVYNDNCVFFPDNLLSGAYEWKCSEEGNLSSCSSSTAPMDEICGAAEGYKTIAAAAEYCWTMCGSSCSGDDEDDDY